MFLLSGFLICHAVGWYIELKNQKFLWRIPERKILIRWRPQRSSCIRPILYSLTFKDIFFLEFRNVFRVIWYLIMNLCFIFSQITSPPEYFGTSGRFTQLFHSILWMYFKNKSFIWLSITITMKLLFTIWLFSLI